jgi:hypothetical protein
MKPLDELTAHCIRCGFCRALAFQPKSDRDILPLIDFGWKPKALIACSPEP